MKYVLAAALIAATGTATAGTVNVDLSGATTGTFIDAVGADFAGTFVGQTIVGGTGISGSPTDPLTLLPSNSLVVAAFNPVVSPASNSILPTPGNQGPLSALLDSAASSVTFTAGSADGGTIEIDFFSLTGSLVDSETVVLGSGYQIYTVGSGSFAGFTIFNNDDPAGLRFQNFSYEMADAKVPLPAGGVLLVTALAGVAGLRRRRAA